MENLSNYLDQLNIMADQGDADAGCVLGKMYFLGDGVEKDYEKAVKFFTDATYNGSEEARRNLALCCYYGIGTEVDYDRAFFWLNSLEALNDKDVLRLIATSYRNGTGTKVNYEKAKEYYLKASELGDSNALCSIAYMEMRENPPKYEKAFEYYELASMMGNSKAQYNLGTFYLKGYYVYKNVAKAYEWHQISANNGYAPAQNAVGLYLSTGKRKDYKTAAYWFEKAAEQGDASALYNLGNAYFYGLGKPEDIEKAKDCFTKSHQKGYYQAYLRLSAIQKSGR